MSGNAGSTTGGAPTPPDPRWASPAARSGVGTGGDRVYYPGLDGLRAVAIALVYCFHDRELDLLERLSQALALPLALLVDPILRLAGLPEISFRMRSLVSPLRENGWIGVNIFFVLSGYLITTLLLRERERFGRVDLRSFWIRRILRIWPLYYLVVLICFVLTPLARAAVGIDPGPWRRLAADRLPAFLAFLGNWSLANGGPVPSDSISVLWSVCVEEQFYLVVPLIVAWSGGRWRVALVAGLMAAAIACRYALADAGYRGAALRYNTLANLDTLLAGVMLALLARGRSGAGPASLWGTRLAVVGGGAAIYSITLGYAEAPWRRAADDVLVWAWAVALVAWAASGRDRTSGFLARPTMVWLGRVSYGLYLYHEIALGLVSWASRALPRSPELGTVAALMGPAATIGLAAASYYGIERPFLRLKARWTRVPSRPVDRREEGSARDVPAGDGTMAVLPEHHPEPSPGGPTAQDEP
ncbi:acyltransferase family protein [Tautonia plasticadhaerens]|uniref:O-acetyltransferase OatA n=1 Tax=Tautonia plasticadhaerens TaxID=2527974 RepID=A0A518GWH1_9BACT|nr:acyltransferase [Tautonia plasticadhaerens]QDV32947.1 O-acetyltransferase OatA [Tautonia plasticadhaerens]